MPKTTEVKTSDGKCTYKYNLEKDIKTAIGIAKSPNFLLAAVITNAPITDASVCPYGNE